ncbi:DUF4269 domain-containing protein [Hymenobacter sp. DH14]|uniref:DUF4269 domain-containing protein n=1 Tax=Hymenobacter cyanobacteriorum TaxID=2926463 RepID=A0A9X2AGS5_9BACT|nr:DUF4269 domain-containing protein [Hymenobacter cyanobacteriorum]MCI1189546.1 DUF4269 domain-containing protein [Hymenobacter cyanobacteriorum]
MPDWTDLRYLLTGNQRQQRAYSLLQALNLWPVLADFKPVLAGTIPLGIDITGSDLDVLCEVAPAETQRFGGLLQRHYGRRTGFKLMQHTISGYPSIVSSFRYRGREVEVFGQALPTAQQNGFRHLLVEAAVLEAGGEAWRRAVRRLKKQGLKTEPAFANLLQLPGNPYAALLELEGKSIAELQAYMARHSTIRNW